MTQELLLADTIDTRTPVEIIIDAVEQYNIQELVPMFSGGKDSLVTVNITQKAIAELRKKGRKVKMTVLHCYTGTGAPRNFDYVLAMARDNGWNLHVEWPQDQKEYPQLPYMRYLQENGFPSHSLHSAVMRMLKIESMERFMQKRLGSDVGLDTKDWKERLLNGGVWLVSGRGAGNSVRRKNKHNKERKSTDFKELTARIEDTLPFVKPLIRASRTYVWNYIRKHDLKLIDTYAFVHHSLECNCGAMAKKGELKELQLWNEQTDNIAVDIAILNDQFGGKHPVTDERGRTYLKDFGYWGWKPKRKVKLDEKQEQLAELVCFGCQK